MSTFTIQLELMLLASKKCGTLFVLIKLLQQRGKSSLKLRIKYKNLNKFIFVVPQNHLCRIWHIKEGVLKEGEMKKLL